MDTPRGSSPAPSVRCAAYPITSKSGSNFSIWCLSLFGQSLKTSILMTLDKIGNNAVFRDFGDFALFGWNQIILFVSELRARGCRFFDDDYSIDFDLMN